ncbi:MAG: hypothetical protein ABIJ12_08970 [bacterium]
MSKAKNSSNNYQIYSLFFLSAIIVRIVFHWLTNYTFDDAYITFRYAENIANGLGFVYNAGEKLLGTTTPLFTLLLAGLNVIGIPVATSALLISLIASGLTAVIVYRFANVIGFSNFSFIPVIVYIFFPRLLAIDTAGMETALFTFLVTSAFYLQYKKYHLQAIGITSLSVLVRPEGLLVLAILFLYDLFYQRSGLLKSILVSVIILLPWVIFAILYFGSVIPHSMTAKMVFYEHVWSSPALDNFIFVMGWHNLFGIVLSILAAIGCWYLIIKFRYGVIELFWIIATIVALTFSSTLVFRWYIAPIYPIYILFASATLLFLLEKFKSIELSTKQSRIFIGTCLVAALLLANYPNVKNYQNEWNILHTIHNDIVSYLVKYANANDVVCTEDIGYVGYYIDNKILDRVGLVSEVSVFYNRERAYADLILDQKPRWLIISPSDPTADILSDEVFKKLYEKKQKFTYTGLTEWEFEIWEYKIKKIMDYR